MWVPGLDPGLVISRRRLRGEAFLAGGSAGLMVVCRATTGRRAAILASEGRTDPASDIVRTCLRSAWRRSVAFNPCLLIASYAAPRALLAAWQ